MTTGPAHFIEILKTCFKIMDTSGFSEAVIHCMFRTGLEAAAREANLALGADGSLSRGNLDGRISIWVYRLEVFGRTDVARIGRRSIIGIIGTDGDGIGLTAASIWHCGVADFNAGADVASARIGCKEVWKWTKGRNDMSKHAELNSKARKNLSNRALTILHLAFLPRGGGLAVVDAVEVAARTIVVVTEATSTIDTHGRIDAVVLAASAFGAGIAGVADANAVMGNEVGAAVHGRTSDQSLVLVDFLRNVGHSIGICGGFAIPFQHIMIATLVIG